MPGINFFFEDFKEDSALTNPQVSQWIISVIEQNQVEFDELNYIYCSDNYLLKVNKTYLDHNYYTDIITFDNRDEPGEPIEADIFISIDRVKENALNQKVNFADELHRVMIHGVLHLLGYNDKSDDEKHQMRKKEEAYLSLRKF